MVSGIPDRQIVRYFVVLISIANLDSRNVLHIRNVAPFPIDAIIDGSGEPKPHLLVIIVSDPAWTHGGSSSQTCLNFYGTSIGALNSLAPPLAP